jgi:hypothetical protein
MYMRFWNVLVGGISIVSGRLRQDLLGTQQPDPLLIHP